MMIYEEAITELADVAYNNTMAGGQGRIDGAFIVARIYHRTENEVVVLATHEMKQMISNFYTESDPHP